MNNKNNENQQSFQNSLFIKINLYLFVIKQQQKLSNLTILHLEKILQIALIEPIELYQIETAYFGHQIKTIMEGNTHLQSKYVHSQRKQNNHFMQRRLAQSLKSKFWTQVNSRDKQLFNDFLPFGYAFFTNQIFEKEFILLFPTKIQQIFQSTHWQIPVNSHDESLVWQRRLGLISECQAINLNIKMGQQKFVCYVFNYLEPIGFPDLLVLNLYSCRINNIETLSYINAPKLRNINLIYNQIYTFKSFAKSSFALKSLHLISTNQKQATYLTRRYYGNNGLVIKKYTPQSVIENYSRWNFPLINLGLQKHRYNSVVMNDLSFLAKGIPTQKALELKVNVAQGKRIKQENVIETLKRNQAQFEVFIPEGDFLDLQYQGLYRPRA